jgi:hypothetical protein
MVIVIAGETKTSSDVDDEEDLDGWGPVRPRRSSMPAPLSADAPNKQDERDEHDDHNERDTKARIAQTQTS